MDKIEEIAIAHLSEFFYNFLTPKNNSVWNRILSKLGHSKLYDSNSIYLTPFTYNGNWQNPNYNFDEYFLGIQEVFKFIYENHKESLFNFIQYCFDEINIDSLYEINELELKNDVNRIINFLKILNISIEIIDKNIVIRPFSDAEPNAEQISLLTEWLQNKYPDCFDLYIESIKNLTDGNLVSCISNCRNIITGIFSRHKTGSEKWVKGLLNITNDNNINNVQVPNNIINSGFNKLGGVRFPRFKYIYSFYSLTCDLGAHSLEGDTINDEVQIETPTFEDALLIFKSVENILVWIKSREQNS